MHRCSSRSHDRRDLLPSFTRLTGVVSRKYDGHHWLAHGHRKSLLVLLRPANPAIMSEEGWALLFSLLSAYCLPTPCLPPNSPFCPLFSSFLPASTYPSYLPTPANLSDRQRGMLQRSLSWDIEASWLLAAGGYIFSVILAPGFLGFHQQTTALVSQMAAVR